MTAAPGLIERITNAVGMTATGGWLDGEGEKLVADILAEFRAWASEPETVERLERRLVETELHWAIIARPETMPTVLDALWREAGIDEGSGT